MGVPIFYGLCRNGPWHKKHLADARETFPVLIDPVDKKGWPAQIAPTTTRPGKLGSYIWNAEDKAWDWKFPLDEASSPA